MVATKGQAIALAVISILAIGSGIAVMVLFKFTYDGIKESQSRLPLLALFWPYAVPVLFTGVMGLVAAGLRNNVAVGLFMAAGIVCLIIESAFAVLAGLVLFFLSCGKSTSCEHNNLINLSRASCAMIVVSWVIMLAGTIMSCAACCCGKRDLGQPGVIIMGSPGYEMQNPGRSYPQNPPYHGQQEHGQQFAQYPQETKEQRY